MGYKANETAWFVLETSVNPATKYVVAEPETEGIE
jgi:hypothetical protein